MGGDPGRDEGDMSRLAMDMDIHGYIHGYYAVATAN